MDTEAFNEFMREFQGESDRGCVLIGASYLDERLSEILIAFLVEHPLSYKLIDGFNAPLQTMSSRILACFCVGLISEIAYKDLEYIRKIRNEFAHCVLGVSFENTKIRDLCRNLHSRIGWDPTAFEDIEEWRKKEQAAIDAPPRNKFIYAVFALTEYLRLRMKSINNEKRSTVDNYST